MSKSGAKRTGNGPRSTRQTPSFGRQGWKEHRAEWNWEEAIRDQANREGHDFSRAE